eukprot:2196506-Prymnesium_polylepis.1
MPQPAPFRVADPSVYIAACMAVSGGGAPVSAAARTLRHVCSPILMRTVSHPRPAPTTAYPGVTHLSMNARRLCCSRACAIC